jgi:hypothetical protein
LFLVVDKTKKGIKRTPSLKESIMKNLLLAVAISFASIFAQADEIQSTDSTLNTQGKLTWTCGLAFTGTSAGIKIILGKFTTTATGTLGCVDLEGNHF